MAAADDIRTLRQRVAELEAELARVRGDGRPGAMALVLKTIPAPAGTVYPTAALAFYPVVIQTVVGLPTPGTAATLTDDPPAAAMVAVNLGGQVPPPGTGGLLAADVGGTLCFTFNG